ncbi:MAG: hypothetical protein KGH53_02245 [Candidatus Micrarchaeota archaeon]|nr:hypothetical protein [Candidatus Micrarchaeota archaeon]
MQYFDLTNSKIPMDPKLAKRLGFKRVLNIGEDVEILDSIKQTKNPFLISSTNPNIIYNLIKSPNAIGLLTNGEEIDPKTINKLKENEKLLVFNAYYLEISQRDRISKVHKLKKSFREGYRAKVGMAMISLAPNEHYFLSTAQLLEISKMICIEEHAAKKMTTTLGELINDLEA